VKGIGPAVLALCVPMIRSGATRAGTKRPATLARSGFVVPFTIDRLVFLVGLAAPFRQFWGLLAVVMALTLLQGASLTASALGATPDSRLLTPLFETCVAAVVVLLAIENVVAPSLRRRWFIASVVGVLSGFDFGHVLADDWQFAGAHAVFSAVSFNLAVVLGDVVALVLAFVALRMLFRYVVVAVVAWWVFLGLLVGGVAWFLPTRFDARADPNASSRPRTGPAPCL